MSEAEGSAVPELRSVSAGAPLSWIAAGWDNLSAAPGASLFYGGAFVAMGYLLNVFLLRVRTSRSPWPPASRCSVRS